MPPPLPTRDRLGFVEVVAWSGAAGLVAVLLLFGATRWFVPPTLSSALADPRWTGRTPAWFTPKGFRTAEIDSNDQVFAWTYARSRLVFPELDRSQAYRLTLAVDPYRPGGLPPPTVTVMVDGAPQARVANMQGAQALVVEIPGRETSGAVVVIESDVFPAPDETYPLGVMVGSITLEPAIGHFRPTWFVALMTGAAVAALLAGLLWSGVPRLFAVPIGVSILTGVLWLLLLDAAFLSDDVLRLAGIGSAVAAIGALVRAARTWWPRRDGLPDWDAAVGIVASVSALKLAFFTHPQIALTDAGFQVHKFYQVHQGGYFFTSVTPAPSFEFPYAILLYLTAHPFWYWFPSDPQLANLLRGVALVADALVGVAIYAVARRFWGRGTLALTAALLWTVARAPAMALGHANLTNLFGQALFGVAMAAVLWMHRGRRAPAALVAAVVMTLAFLSHFSTLTIGAAIVAALAAVDVIGGPRDVRRTGLVMALVLAAAVTASYALYYSHFDELIAATWTRIASHVDAVSDHSMVASPSVKWHRWITEDQFSNDYGLPGLALFAAALAGTGWLVRDRPGDALTRLLLAWAAVWVAATALGIFTSVELRANLAVAPVLVWLAAYALDELASRSIWGRLAAAAGTGAIAWNGVRVWLLWLGRA